MMQPIHPTEHQMYQSYQPDVAAAYKMLPQDQDVAPLFLFDRDFKIAVLVAIMYIVLTLLPVESFIYRYVALNKIPYANVLIKAVLAGAVVYLVSKWQIL